MKASKVINRIKSDPRVSSVSDERGSGDGFWVYLKPDFVNYDMECGTIHEISPSACLKRFKEIVTRDEFEKKYNRFGAK